MSEAHLSASSSLFDPSRDQVRQFFIHIWDKHKTAKTLTPLEAMALDWVIEHPEYREDLEHPDALNMDYSMLQGKTNPFLHLSMHLAIAEQLSIDHPPGIVKAYQQLVKRSNVHQAAHEIMECLGQVVWESQRLGNPLDNVAYIDLIWQRLKN